MKYIKKSTDEIDFIKREMLRNALISKEPFLFGVLTILLTFISVSFFPSKYSGDVLGPSLKIFILSLVFGVVVAVFVFLVQAVSHRKFGDQSYVGICENCLITYRVGKSKCGCGGKIEPSEFYNEIK